MSDLIPLEPDELAGLIQARDILATSSNDEWASAWSAVMSILRRGAISPNGWAEGAAKAFAASTRQDIGEMLAALPDAGIPSAEDLPDGDRIEVVTSIQINKDDTVTMNFKNIPIDSVDDFLASIGSDDGRRRFSEVYAQAAKEQYGEIL